MARRQACEEERILITEHLNGHLILDYVLPMIDTNKFLVI